MNSGNFLVILFFSDRVDLLFDLYFQIAKSNLTQKPNILEKNADEEFQKSKTIAITKKLRENE